MTPATQPTTSNSALNKTIDKKDESGTAIPSCSGAAVGAAATDADDKQEKQAAAGEGEARAAAPANSKEKTPMCLVNELARYNKVRGVGVL